MKKIKKAVILAGGYGKRMSPITKAIPKEMLPLGRKPVLEYIIEEIQEAGIHKICIVSRPGKEAISSYFEGYKDIKIIFEHSKSSHCAGIICARDFIDQDDFLLALGDAPIDGKGANLIIPQLYDLFISKNAVLVTAMFESQSNSESKDNENTIRPLKTLGRSILSPQILDLISQENLYSMNDLFSFLVQNQYLLLYSIFDNCYRYDIGSFKGYFEAFEAYAQKERERDKIIQQLNHSWQTAIQKFPHHLTEPDSKDNESS
ncbi:MAG: NTP transferase domain-containing protein [Desulfobacterales bacterium]|nr:NTP transferase domain-containing protein [Desulfobacterales bacterium]